MKVSFINEFAGLSEQVGADINEIAVGIGLDERIGQRYLLAGAGWGGSCFGKDIKALLHTASQFDYEMYLVEAAIKVNRPAKFNRGETEKTLQVIRETISILGISLSLVLMMSGCPFCILLKNSPGLEPGSSL